MAGTHARYSPSGASGWTRCADWTADPTGSKYANWGTAAHEIAARALQNDKQAADYKGITIVIDNDDYLVDDEMVECVQSYLDTIRDIGGQLLVEQRMPIDHLTGEVGAGGTADAVIFKDGEMIVADLKTGIGVKVDAENNEQLLMYAHAAMTMFEPVYEFDRVRMMIVQPRIGQVSEWVITVDALVEFGLQLKIATEVVAGDKQCRWCAKKGTCPTLAATVRAEFEAIDPPAEAENDALAGALAKLDLIEAWCKAVYAEAERRLQAGQQIPGYKLVEGKKGARAWDDEKTIEEMLKAMRLRQDEMYQFKLMSPTQLEKALKDQPKRWAKLQEHITQKSGSPAVVPVADKRQAITVSREEFTPITETV